MKKHFSRLHRTVDSWLTKRWFKATAMGIALLGTLLGWFVQSEWAIGAVAWEQTNAIWAVGFSRLLLLSTWSRALAAALQWGGLFVFVWCALREFFPRRLGFLLKRALASCLMLAGLALIAFFFDIKGQSWVTVDSAQWVLSAMAQSSAALLGLMAMVYVFSAQRVDMLSREMRAQADKLRDLLFSQVPNSNGRLVIDLICADQAARLREVRAKPNPEGDKPFSYEAWDREKTVKSLLLIRLSYDWGDSKTLQLFQEFFGEPWAFWGEARSIRHDDSRFLVEFRQANHGIALDNWGGAYGKALSDLASHFLPHLQALEGHKLVGRWGSRVVIIVLALALAVSLLLLSLSSAITPAWLLSLFVGLAGLLVLFGVFAIVVIMDWFFETVRG